ncbi:MAG: delta-60 repeat domain-containing protein, partial [Acidobacteriota bacterium]|nr:delta-60 repeat domain-containing protein [Acidobacteriota bacterium]
MSFTAIRGQSALDGFDPNANDLVRVIVVQPDGKILIGGDFTTLAPNGGAAVTRNHIARLNPDGTLDTSFNPNANGLVLAIALQADGKILVGGAFTNIGGQPRNRMARLDASGSADSFDPSPNDFVFAIALQADGKILVGGDFRGANSIGGQMRNRMARLDPATGLADPFDPSASATVHSIVVQADGKILVGGEFTGIGGQPRNRMARLDVAMGAADSFDPSANGTVDTIALQADGKILVGGEFHGANSIGGQTRTGVARLDATTGLADSSFNPNPAPFNAIVYAIALQADGKILAGGTFTSIGGQPRVRLARLDAVTGLADSLDPNANGGSFPAVLAIAVQADGKIIAGGAFTALTPNGGAAVTRNRIARLETDGLLDKTLNLNVTGSQIGSGVYATAIQRDGKILIGGKFETVLGVTRNNIARLNTDGTLDMAFNPNASNTVNAIAVQMDGKILVGGDFNGPSFLTTIGGQSRNYIARLDATSGQADSFDPQASATVNSIALQADAKILVGGVFSTIGGQPRNRIARLDPGTGQADPFDPNPTGTNTYVNSVVVQADGKILVGGGGFTGIGGQPRNRIARLDPATGLADSFDPSADNTVNAIALQADGKVLAGGVFSNIGGQPRSRIARLDATTGLADSFNPNAIPNATVFSIVVQADGKILVAGSFL